MCFFIFLFCPLIKRIKKPKIHIKSELEVTIKVSDSKNVEIVSVMKEVESVVKNIGIKQQELCWRNKSGCLKFGFFLSSGKRFDKSKNSHHSCFG